MIDLHTHILPGVDDGVQSLDNAIEILKRAARAGIKRIVLTPHILEFPSDKDWHKISSTFDSLSHGIYEEKIDVTIHLGAELYISPDLPQMIKTYPGLTINGGNRYALIELPANEIPPFTMEIMYRLMLRGIVPILAHPERNIEIQEKPEKLSELIGKGIITQLNSESLAGKYGKKAQKTAKVLLIHDLIHLLASDLHTLAEGPYPLLKGICLASKLVGEKRANDMVTTISAKIIKGESIDLLKPKPIKRTIFKNVLR